MKMHLDPYIKGNKNERERKSGIGYKKTRPTTFRKHGLTHLICIYDSQFGE